MVKRIGSRVYARTMNGRPALITGSALTKQKYIQHAHKGLELWAEMEV